MNRSSRVLGLDRIIEVGKRREPGESGAGLGLAGSEESVCASIIVDVLALGGVLNEDDVLGVGKDSDTWLSKDAEDGQLAEQLGSNEGGEKDRNESAQDGLWRKEGGHGGEF